MKKLPLLLSAALALSIFSSVRAQDVDEDREQKAGPRNPPAQTRKDPLAETRRGIVTSMILALGEEAKSFRDTALAARTLARTADLLWDMDRERAINLFKRAWESANTADDESRRQFEEERARRSSGGVSFGATRPTNMKAEVLRLLSRRSKELTEEFLAKLETTVRDQADAASSRSQSDGPFSPPESLRQRLNLANELLANDEIARAIDLAVPALAQPTIEGLAFLSRLRLKNAQAADQQFLAMLHNAATDLSSDANTVSLLSSYVFTPYLFITVGPSGGVNTSQMDMPQPPPDMPSGVRNQFLVTAADILMRPFRAGNQATAVLQRGLDPTPTYLITQRLLPLYDQYHPELASVLRGQLAALASNVSDSVRNSQSPWLTKGLVPEESRADELKSVLERAERASNQASREMLYAEAARIAASRGDLIAREYADKIDSLDVRKAVRGFVDFELINRALNKKDADLLLKVLPNAQLSSIQRVWALTGAAKLLVKNDSQRAIQFLDDAAGEARRIDGLEPDRVRALIAVATLYFDLDKSRSWVLVLEIVKAANAADGFTGEAGQISGRLEVRQSISVMNTTVTEFNVGPLFRLLAKDDFERAIELAKALKADAPRAAATIAIAQEMLSTTLPSAASL